MNTFCQRILLLAVALAFLSPALRSEQPQKASHLTQEDRIKRLEERADAAEKAASTAATEKEFTARTQKVYESFYDKAFNTQLWTLAIAGLLLTAVLGFVARFGLNLFEQRTKLATADATAQMRNEYARILAKEVQKLLDSNAADTRKLKEALTGQIEELEQKLKDRSDFQMQFVQGLAAGTEECHDDSVVAFRQALRAYKAGKPRSVMEREAGATSAKFLFESLRKTHGDKYVEKARKELTDPLYNGLDEELALAALHIAWLAPLIKPLIKERSQAAPEPPAPEPAAKPRPAAPAPPAQSGEADWSSDEESDSCRLINS